MSGMKVRVNKQKFEDGVPLNWAGRSSLQNHVLNTLSLMFPDGERFFIRSVKHFSDEISDEQFQKDIRTFIGQESQHGRAHERFNDAVSEKAGDMGWFLKLFTVPTFEVLEPFLMRFRSKVFKSFALSVTAAAENMTAGFADMLFSSDQLERIRRDDIRELFKWHAAEEIEHRDLAYDLFMKVDGSYMMRMAGMSFAYGIIALYVAVGTAYFISRDKNYRLENLAADFIQMLTEEKALGRVYIEGMLDYMRPGFHPSDNPVPAIAEEYLASEMKEVG